MTQVFKNKLCRHQYQGGVSDPSEFHAAPMRTAVGKGKSSRAEHQCADKGKVMRAWIGAQRNKNHEAFHQHCRSSSNRHDSEDCVQNLLPPGFCLTEFPSRGAEKRTACRKVHADRRCSGNRSSQRQERIIRKPGYSRSRKQKQEAVKLKCQSAELYADQCCGNGRQTQACRTPRWRKAKRAPSQQQSCAPHRNHAIIPLIADRVEDCEDRGIVCGTQDQAGKTKGYCTASRAEVKHT